MRRRPIVQQAFDEARFGATRILNVRDSLPSGAEAARRADGWLRSKQMERAGEVLIITGRGSGSVGQVPVVREEIRKLLNALRRAGVVEQFGEHNPGSFVIQMAPLRALFEAPRRERSAPPPEPSSPLVPPTLTGLDPSTRRSLHQLATISLESLGLVAPAETLVVAEMERQFALLVCGAPETGVSDAWLQGVIAHALEEFEERGR
jgi:hypothetical protein